jgi:hypothetical protein
MCPFYILQQLFQPDDDPSKVETCSIKRHILFVLTIHIIIIIKFVSVALVIQHVMRMRRSTFPMCPVWVYNTFPHYLINGTIFGEKVLNIKYVLISNTNLLKHISV